MKKKLIAVLLVAVLLSQLIPLAFAEESHICQPREAICCSVCSLEISHKFYETPASEHTWGEYAVLKPASETEHGLEAKSCATCGEMYVKPIYGASKEGEVGAGYYSRNGYYIPTPKEVYDRAMALQEYFPTGIRWTNESHYIGKMGGGGCAGFAAMLSDMAYGKAPVYYLYPGEFTFQDIAAGDYIRINNDYHSIFVLEKHENYIVYADGNHSKTVFWDCFMSEDWLMQTVDYIIRRYPEAPVNSCEENGHMWDEGVITKPATETETGMITYTCRICGAIREEETLTLADDPCANFIDIDRNAWYHAAVDFVLKNGYMNGMPNGRFAPNGQMTRAQLVQILYNLEGRPAIEYIDSFTDVSANAWYVNAIIWAAQNGVVNGIGEGLFGPEKQITREQMAVMLFRYFSFKGVDTTARVDISSFTDGNKVSDWALDAMQWANAAGLINGSKEGDTILLNPQGNATRAQVAQVFFNYFQSCDLDDANN